MLLSTGIVSANADNAEKTVTAVILKEFRPISFIDAKTGKPSGFAVELIEDIARKTGLHIKYMVVNEWKAVDEALQNGTADITPSIVATKERQPYINFTEPNEITNITIHVRSKTGNIQKLSDLYGKTAGVIIGSQGHNFAKDYPEINLQMFVSFNTALFELLSGRIDGLIAPEHIVRQIAEEAGVTEQIKSLTPAVKEVKRSIGVRKTDLQLFNLIKQPVADFVNTPEYQKLYKKWYGTPYSFWTVRRVAISMGAIFTAILALLALVRYLALLKINRRIKDSEHRFKGIFDQTTQLVGLLDSNGILLEVNHTALDMIGASIDDVRNHPFIDCPWWNHDESLKNRLIKAIEEAKEGKLVRFPATHISKNGEVRHIDFSIKPVFDDDGKLCLLIPEGRDVTDRVLVEYELNEQAELLEQEIAERQQTQEKLNAINESLEARITASIDEIRNKDALLLQQSRLAAMGELLSNIAHQWRQPLNNIGLYIQNMQYLHKSGELTDDEMDQDIASVMDILKSMSHTIDDFRKFFLKDRIKVEFPLRETIDRSLSLISAGLDSGNIKINISGESDLRVTGFPNEYAQALMNILYNARDVLIERKIENPEIDISVKKEGQRSVLTVKDNGGGISEDILSQIFDPYFSTKGSTQGTGIGLYMAKTMIEKHMNGKLTASNREHGAEFKITL